MTVASGWWLLALLVVPVIWKIAAAGVAAVPRRQTRAAVWVRTVIVCALVASLAGVAVVLPDDTVATVFVVDVSDSISAHGIDEAETFIRDALDTKPTDALAGVVVFGREARVELSVQEQPDLISIATEPDRSRTDISRALRLAQALVPEGAKPRVVLISDGRANSGKTDREISRLRKRGVPVDTVPLGTAAGADAAVVSVKAPGRARTEDKFEVVASIFSRSAGPASVVLKRAGSVVASLDVALPAGLHEVTFEQEAAAPGALLFSVEVRAPGDTVPDNDAAGALVIVDGPPRVIVLEGSSQEGKDLAAGLTARGMSVEVRDVSTFPSGEEIAATDAIVLVDVEAWRLSDLQVAILGGFVSELGRGLVTVGGESSFSLGGYRNSPLEALLPLESEIKDPRRRPSVAQVLAVDTSGSMGQCHCAGPNMANDRLAEGPNKTTISREAAAKAIDALNQDDEVGVLAFNTSSKWVIPLQRLPSSEVVKSGLQRLRPTGGTSIPQALRSAMGELSASKASLKHVILFTDGWTSQEGLSQTAAELRQKGITLSVVATGEGPGSELKSMAEAGGGRFYAGRNLDEIPEIFMNEVILAARRYVNEGEYFPAITASTPATDALNETPALLGYVSTSAKPSTAVSLAVGELQDPLLASWRKGLGTVTSWTSDAKPRWAARWVGWDGFADFWSAVVRETLPASPAPGFDLAVLPSSDETTITVASEDAIAEGSTAHAKVTRPDGTSETVTLERVSAREMRGRLQTSGPGTYLVSAELMSDGQAIFRDTAGGVVSYPAEYLPGASEDDEMARIARVTRGRHDVSTERVFDPSPTRARRSVALSGWLLALAVGLLPVDIALRRLIITKEDLLRLRSRGSGSKRRPAEPTHVSELLRARTKVRADEEG